MNEPTLILYSVLTGINSVQWTTVNIPTWAHLLVTVLSGGLTAFINRQKVTPY